MIVDLNSGGSESFIEGITHGSVKTTSEQKIKQSSGREENKEHANKISSGILPNNTLSIAVCNFPDMYTSDPAPGIFRQPFTRSQQLQMRAQIYVYGALKYGEVPDETYMDSAFGASDRGKDVWEPAFRIRVEQTRSYESLESANPVHQYLGDRPSGEIYTQSSLQIMTVHSPLGQATSRDTPSPIVKPMLPLMSPLWNIPTPDQCQALSTFHRLKAPVEKLAQDSVGPNTSYISNSSFPGPLAASSSPQTSSFDTRARVNSGLKHASPSTFDSTAKLASENELSNLAVATSRAMIHSSSFDFDFQAPLRDGQEAVKGGKSSTPEDLGFNFDFQAPLRDGQETVKGRKSSTPEGLGFNFDFQAPPRDGQEAIEGGKSSTPEGLGQVSKLWVEPDNPVDSSHLSMPISSRGYVSNLDLSLSPASSDYHLKMSVEATCSKVQEAKRQAEDAAVSVATAKDQRDSLLTQLNKQSQIPVSQDIEANISSSAMVIEAACAVAKAAAIAAKIASDTALRAKLADKTLASHLNSLTTATPVIVSANEASRKRVVDAFAASKHLENLDAIVKAAELALKAVVQAKQIASMGNPLPLGASSCVSYDGVTSDQYSIQQSQEDLVQNIVPKKDLRAECGFPCLSKEALIESVGGKLSSFARHEKESSGKMSLIASDMAKIIGTVPESEMGLRFNSSTVQDSATLVEDSIKEASLVEVYKGETKRGWFSANVLSLEDGKAFVCYTHLQSDEGEEKLKEWVAVDAKVNSAPKIRIAHPATSMRPDGSRKRGRIAVTDFYSSVGDRVDVWVPDCLSWREGVVTEKDKKDDRTVIVSFPDEEETLVAKTWHLRPTLIWKEGTWIPWSSSAGENNPSQANTPQGKRMKLGVPEADGKQNGNNNSRRIEIVEPKKSKNLRLQPLSNHEKTRKQVRGKGLTDLPKTVPISHQTERSREFSGIPNPGKKRNLTEVTKKKMKTNGSPKTFGSCRQKITSRNDPKEELVVPKADKVPNRPQSLNHKSISSGTSALNGDSSTDNRVVSLEAPSKNISLSKAKSEQVSRRKPTPICGKFSKRKTQDKFDNGNAGQPVSEVVEPRRSNRKMQPTSKLLEGLESSIISKTPVAPYDKSCRSQHKATPKASR